jgi:hypothetical protein
MWVRILQGPPNNQEKEPKVASEIEQLRNELNVLRERIAVLEHKEKLLKEKAWQDNQKLKREWEEAEKATTPRWNDPNIVLYKGSGF